jgi:hypothetical protein
MHPLPEDQTANAAENLYVAKLANVSLDLATGLCKGEAAQNSKFGLGRCHRLPRPPQEHTNSSAQLKIPSPANKYFRRR